MKVFPVLLATTMSTTMTFLLVGIAVRTDEHWSSVRRMSVSLTELVPPIVPQSMTCFEECLVEVDPKVN